MIFIYIEMINYYGANQQRQPIDTLLVSSVRVIQLGGAGLMLLLVVVVVPLHVEIVTRRTRV